MCVWTVNEIASIVGGRAYGQKEDLVCGISLDSRSVKKGELFVPLVGSRYDGHLFIENAWKNGATVVLSAQELSTNVQGTWIRVEDTLMALQQLGRHCLEMVNPQVVAVTGSTGKTSTKELIATVLRQQFKVFHSKGNLNSEQGLPLSLCQLKQHHEMAVLEMGMRGFGQITELVNIAPPDIAVITNIGTVHAEILGSQENIALAKAEILMGLKPGGHAVLNGDDPWCRQIGTKFNKDILYYGFATHNDVRAEEVKVTTDGYYQFVLKYKQHSQKITMPVVGKHHVYNALAGACVGVLQGMSLSQIARGIQAFRTIKGRQCIKKCRDVWIIDDTYNANPDSMRAGLEQLKYAPGSGKRIAVLGDMRELGPTAMDDHIAVGRELLDYGVNILLCLGDLAHGFAAGAKQQGMSEEVIYQVDNNRAAVSKLQAIVHPEDNVLVKGSNSLRMHEIVAQFCKE